MTFDTRSVAQMRLDSLRAGRAIEAEECRREAVRETLTATEKVFRRRGIPLSRLYPSPVYPGV